MKKFVIRWLVLLMVLPGIVYAPVAQAQAPAASVMARTISALIQNKAIQRGFAANDPRIAATLSGAGTQIAGGAAAAAVVTLAGVTAPEWVTVAATVALGAIFSYGLNLAVDKVKLYINSNDGSATWSVKPTGSLKNGQNAFTDGYGTWGANEKDVGLAVNAAPNIDCQLGCFTVPLGVSGDYYQYMTWRTIQTQSGPLTQQYFGAWNVRIKAYTGTDCEGVIANGSCTNSPPNAVAAGTVQDAVNQLSDSDKSAPVNPAIVAQIAQKAWEQAAAQPNYQGLPVDTSNPITASDAQAYQSANSTSWPTVGDAVAPQSGSSAWVLPVSTTSPGTGGDTSGDTGGTTPPTIDWTIGGSSESIPKQSVPVSYTPTLFAAPTGCPAPVTFTMFGKQYSIGYEPFCGLMTTVAPIFLALGAASAALIFARSLKT